MKRTLLNILRSVKTEKIKFSNNDIIIEPYQNKNSLYYIIEGKAKIYQEHENGNISLIQYLCAGDFIGELYLLGIEEESKLIKSHGDSVLYQIKENEFYDKLYNDIYFMQLLSQFLGRKLLHRTHHYTEIQQYNFTHCFVKYIQDMNIEGYILEDFVQLSQYLGVSYRHLMHVLNELKRSGALEKMNGKYRIKDKEKLNDFL